MIFDKLTPIKLRQRYVIKMDEKLKFIGTGENSPVYIEFGAYMHIIKYAKAGSLDGSRGVLLGKHDKDKIYISTALEAMYTGDEGIEAPSFTKQSWSRISAEVKETYSELEILGQYSTHRDTAPDEVDEAMQKSFFDGEKLLFIFDPVSNGQDIYEYDEGECKKLGGIYIFDKFGNPLDLHYKDSILMPVNREMELREKILGRIEHKQKVRSKIYAAMFVVVAIICAYLVVQSIELSLSAKTLKKKTNDLQWVINQNEQQISELKTEIEELKKPPQTSASKKTR